MALTRLRSADRKPRHLASRQLTAAESEACQLVPEGLTNREIAIRLGITENVVKNYMRRVFDKLGVWSRVELTIMLLQRKSEPSGRPNP